ncbi:uncharacterized protein LOC135389498 [Ornithodoros turicata]|uniref:uncharacterized protein LOC135389498 n=1 Tax=Ornithodoros turicata TaxID=34597 RepID=UPI003139BD68
MSTDTFLRAFRRFVSRRGVPRIIYTDNALTFKRSKKHLEELWNGIRNPAVQDHFAGQKVQWKFIVERAPWWGGFYERLMGSTKLALKKTIGTKFLSADELTTYLCEIEAVLNSRPLTHLYDEPQEPVPLCPAYFLAGRGLTTLPNLTGPEVTNIAHNQLRKSWSDRQMVLAAFWKRWSKDYLAELKTGPSTRGRKATIEERKLVLLQETARWQESKSVSSEEMGRSGRAC